MSKFRLKSFYVSNSICDKNNYKSVIKFEDGQSNEFSIAVDGEMQKKIIELLSDQIRKNAAKLASDLCSSILGEPELLSPPAPPAPEARRSGEII